MRAPLGIDGRPCWPPPAVPVAPPVTDGRVGSSGVVIRAPPPGIGRSGRGMRTALPESDGASALYPAPAAGPAERSRRGAESRASGSPPASAQIREFLRASVANGARDRARVEPLLDQLLPELPLARQPEEQPDERRQRDERALDHHHAPCDPLV